MRPLVLVLVLAACGDDTPDHPIDAPRAADAAPDAPVLVGCDYIEQRDSTNDDVSPATGVPESTSLTFTTRTVVCGTLDSTHFDGDITVDVDGYVFTVATETDVLVRLHGTGLDGPELVGLDVYTGATFTQLVGSANVHGTHGVTALHLVPGTYELTAFALDGAAITAGLPYRIELVSDAPATRCPELTTGGYVEAIDGGANTGNDMIRLVSGTPPAMTTSAADMPEPTLFAIEGGMSYRVTGSAADVAVADTYEDVDMFAFTTAAATNELAVRLTWPGTTTNLDYLVFEGGTTDAVIRAIGTANQAPELRTFAVKPASSYWLLVGAKAGTGALPAAYTASLCGATFAP